MAMTMIGVGAVVVVVVIDLVLSFCGLAPITMRPLRQLLHLPTLCPAPQCMLHLQCVQLQLQLLHVCGVGGL
jgi:hypothetical protein